MIMKKIDYGWVKLFECPKCKNKKLNYVEYRNQNKIRYRCTKCKYTWYREVEYEDK